MRIYKLNPVPNPTMYVGGVCINLDNIAHISDVDENSFSIHFKWNIDSIYICYKTDSIALSEHMALMEAWVNEP